MRLIFILSILVATGCAQQSAPVDPRDAKIAALEAKIDELTVTRQKSWELYNELYAKKSCAEQIDTDENIHPDTAVSYVEFNDETDVVCFINPDAENLPCFSSAQLIGL